MLEGLVRASFACESLVLCECPTVDGTGPRVSFGGISGTPYASSAETAFPKRTLAPSRPRKQDKPEGTQYQPMFPRLNKRLGTIILGAALTAAALIPTASGVLADKEEAQFPLVVASAKLLPCLARDADNPPTATVNVQRGDLNDTLHLRVRGLKPGLAFDLFTVQRSNKLADGSADPRDIRTEQVCMACGGGGAVTDLAGKNPIEHQTGFIADRISIAGFWK